MKQEDMRVYTVVVCDGEESLSCRFLPQDILTIAVTTSFHCLVFYMQYVAQAEAVKEIHCGISFTGG